MPPTEVLSELIVPLLGAVSGGIAAYVAIRADLAATKAQIVMLTNSTQRAHDRIDAHIERGHA